MRTMWRIRYPILVFAVLACGVHTAHEPDTDRMAAVLEEMIHANSETSGDSLIARRNAILEKHNTDEAEVRAWIARMKTNPEESQRVALQLAAVMDEKATRPSRKKD